jgi:hypothetical protein
MAGQPLPGRLAHLVGVEAEVVEERTGRLVAGKAHKQVGHIDVLSTRAIGVFESGVAKLKDLFIDAKREAPGRWDLLTAACTNIGGDIAVEAHQIAFRSLKLRNPIRVCGRPISTIHRLLSVGVSRFSANSPIRPGG